MHRIHRNAGNTNAEEFVLCQLQVILNGTYETIEETQLDKQRTLIHLLQLQTNQL